ncbi:hypothetical protein EC973_006298 [Apophysomyces ossiformis]|uniref:Peptidase A1 domain-containing protein n=1 Tax=Apophysomyces ossiformis TaxID=679940 RepID=A0A8H7BW62_9FUNG|nr:hypothetical protein EC973_006298 [Apophysomyces ossiformis]
MRTAIFCLAAIAQLVLAAAEPTKIPLYRRSDNGIVKAAGQELSNGVLAGKVKIGGQEFTMAFDTTTGFSWVRGSKCKTENCLDRCTYYARRSDGPAHPTAKKFSVEYGNACVDTHVVLDTFEFAGLKVKNMPFGSAYRMSGFDHGFDGYLGLGRNVDWNQTKIHSTAAGSLSKRDMQLPDSAFVPNAYQQASGIDSAQFGMYTTTTSDNGFGANGAGDGGQLPPTNPNQPGNQTPPPPVNGTTTNQPSQSQAPQPQQTPTDNGVTSGGFGFVKRHNKDVAGYLVLGGVDSSVIEGDVSYIKLSDKHNGWDVCIRDASFGHLNLEQEKGAVASISTSSHFITLPADQADKFHAKFGGKYYQSTKTYSVKCSDIKKLPPLKVTLEDHVVEIPASYWTREIDADRDCCATNIARGNSNADWVLGTTFTNAFYTTFDTADNRIGLALKKGQKNDGLKIYKK